jgi:hypothetical protein
VVWNYFLFYFLFSFVLRERGGGLYVSYDNCPDMALYIINFITNIGIIIQLTAGASCWTAPYWTGSSAIAVGLLILRGDKLQSEHEEGEQIAVTTRVKCSFYIQSCY